LTQADFSQKAQCARSMSEIRSL